MKKKIIFTLSLILMLCLFVSGAYIVNAENDYSFRGGVIETQYYKHEYFKVPDAEFGNVKADYVTVFPSGKRVTDYYFKLTEGGNYRIEYSAFAGGKTLEKTVGFTVDTPAYSVEKTQSSVRYGKDNKYGSGNQGIIVSLAEGDVFHYNRVINVYNSSKGLPVIDFGFYPETFNKIDANNMFITFTDIYDQNNKVTCWFKLTLDNLNYMKLFTKATDQVWGGYENRGKVLTYHKNNQYGTPIDLKPGYYGTEADKNYKSHFGFYFVAEENSLRINNELGYGKWHSNDISNYFGDPALQENPWNGFTTGDVYMDIWFENYHNNSASLIINSVLDEDITDAYFKDDIPPEIDVSEEFDTSVPAVKGYYYPVNPAVAKDLMSGGTVDCSVSVFYNYSRPTGDYSDFNGVYDYQAEVENGRFKAERLGFYSVVYRATDWYGNKSEKVVSVKVTDNNVVPVTGLTLNGVTEVAATGGLCYLPECSGATGGVGNISYGYEVYSGEKEYEILYNYANQPYFVPDKTGAFTVRVFAEDLFGVRDAVEYTVTATSACRIIKDVPVLPLGIIGGYEYELPSVNVYGNDGNVIEKAGIKIIDGDGERVYRGKEVFTPDENGNAVIIYYTEGLENVYTIPVLTVFNDFGEISAKDYFILSDGMSSAMTIKGTEFTADSDADATFSVAQVCDTFGMIFTSVPNKSDFGELVLTLTDSSDYKIAISIGLINNGENKCNISLNGKATNIYVNAFAFGSQKLCSVRYGNKNTTFTCDDRNVSVDKTLYGECFKGFTGGKIYITVSLKGVKEESSFVLSSINDQMLNIDVAMDNNEPNIAVDNTYNSLTVDYGGTLTVYKARVSDVLDPGVKVTVSFTLDGVPLVSSDGITLKNVPCDREYTVTLNGYGVYLLKYQATDGNDNPDSISYRIQVIDGEKPVLNVGNVPVKLSRGEIKLPTATATDNVTEKPVVWAVVYDPAGNIVFLDGGKFTAVHSGIYKVIYYAIDKAGNTASLSYLIAID